MKTLEQHLSNNRQLFSEQQMHRQFVYGHYASPSGYEVNNTSFSRIVSGTNTGP
jgi:hypothetical protein